MPRNLGPRLVSEPSQALKRGALIVIGERQRGGDRTQDSLVFQYNPETVTRNRTGEWTTKHQRRARGDQRERPRDSRQQVTGLDGHVGGGLYAKSETISFKVVFDATELILGSSANEDEGLGILPELAFIEGIALGGTERKKQRRNSSARNRPTAPTEVVLVLGKRLFPVVITSVTVTEQRFDSELVPIRAEVDLKFRILEAGEVRQNPQVQQAFDEVLLSRASWAAKANPSPDEAAIISALQPGSSWWNRSDSGSTT